MFTFNLYMNPQKLILLTVLFFSPLAFCFAGSNVPMDIASGAVVYKQTFHLSSSLSEEAIYEIAQNWFNDPSQFTRENEAVPFDKSQLKNKQIVDKAFDNSRPLQSIDPESKRIAGRGLVKYAGSNTSFIQLLYIEYYIVIEVKGHDLVATISNLKYHHINRKTYAPMAIYNWSGSKPSDAADTFENLVQSQSNTEEINKLCSYLNSDMQDLFGNLKSLLENNKALASNG